jgi:hypothetical protein
MDWKFRYIECDLRLYNVREKSLSSSRRLLIYQGFGNIDSICNKSFGLLESLLSQPVSSNIEAREHTILHILNESKKRSNKILFICKQCRSGHCTGYMGNLCHPITSTTFPPPPPPHPHLTHSKQQLQRILHHLLKLPDPLATHSTIHNLMIKASRNNYLIIPVYRCPLF